jgi:hypothetical protein
MATDHMASDTVYLLGAGFNRSICDLEGATPPLATDFFPTCLPTRMGARIWSKSRHLAAYVERYWGMSTERLSREGIDIEALFTFLEYHRQRFVDGAEGEAEAVLAEFDAKLLLSEWMAHFEGFLGPEIKKFAQLAMAERATILTFNYDCILERAIEVASDLRPQIRCRKKPADAFTYPDNTLAYGPWNWDRARGYGVPFDELELEIDGIKTWGTGPEFYSGRPLYDPAVLKLHGSVSWFRYFPLHSFRRGPNAPKLPKELAGRLLLKQHSSVQHSPHFRNGWMLDPVIVTPVMLKDQYYRMPLFQRLWTQAEEALMSCRRLVIIGYSFPPTDANIRNLFRYVSARRRFQQLVIVNPSDTHAASAVTVTRVGGEPTRFRDLKHFVDAEATSELSYDARRGKPHPC